MGEAKQKPKRLQPRQLQAAVLEAGGAKRADIAKIVGRSEKVITNWRNDETYAAEVDRLREQTNAVLEPLLTRVRSQIVAGAEEAVATMRDALEAENKDGQAAWMIRLRAAEALAALVPSWGIVVGKGGEGAGAGAVAQAAVIVVPAGQEVRELPRSVPSTAEDITDEPGG